MDDDLLEEDSHGTDVVRSLLENKVAFYRMKTNIGATHF